MLFDWLSGVGGGSLGSSVSHGLSSAALSTRRPGSLVIGATPMSKSSSEPMNLITDTLTVSPNSGQTLDISLLMTMITLMLTAYTTTAKNHDCDGHSNDKKAVLSQR